jgi:3-oxoacyl-ACP reductase-like protein
MSNDTQTAGTSADTTAAPAVAAPAPDTLLAANPAATPAADATAQPAAPASDAPKADDKVEGAPETYADFTMPEGMKANEEAMTELKSFAKERNLSQADAQKLVDLGVKQNQNIVDGYKQHIEQAQAKWATDSQADKEFGGDKLKENMAVAQKALDTYGTPELKTLLLESGLGNHPEVIRAFYRMGQTLSEDRTIAGARAPASANASAQKLYDNSNMNP